MKNELLQVENQSFLNREIPLLDYFYIIPTKRKHSSGYKIMEIIGVNEKLEYKKKLATFSDVVDIAEIFSDRHDYFTVSIDSPDYGVLRVFSINFKFKVQHFGISSFVVDLVKGE